MSILLPWIYSRLEFLSLAIFDFDGTLFDTHESISQTIKLTFEAVLPTQTPPEAEIYRLIASGAGLTDTFKAHPANTRRPTRTDGLKNIAPSIPLTVNHLSKPFLAPRSSY
jgi:phosphoglycolate phosphatase-like HAD superfamily hydrolase